MIVYKSEVVYGDKLKFEVTADDFNKYGYDFFYKITSTETEREVARAKTGIVFFDYEKRKMVEIPYKFRLIFATK